ncbi:MAG: hypothetical protein SGBAC_010367 [Bacillariaceae sp.]
MIPSRISSTRISKGESSNKNLTETFSKGLDNRTIHRAGIHDEIDEMNNIHHDESSSICDSLDKDMPLLLSILRGDKVHVDNDGVELKSVTVINQYGYLTPFASEQRFPSTQNTTVVSENTKRPVIIPGFNHDLIARTLVGKRIYFIGDSTIRILFVALRRLLMVIHNNETIADSDIWHGQWMRNLTDDIEITKHQWRKEGLAPYMAEKDGTYLELVDVNPLYFVPARRHRKDNRTKVNGGNLQKNFLEMLKTQLVKPDVIIFNAGMHLLHLAPMRSLRHDTFASWIQYESLLDSLLQVGLDSGASAALIAKSTNKICSEKLPTDMKRYTKSYHHKTQNAQKECRNSIETQGKDLQDAGGPNITVLSDSQIEEICELGTFDENGSFFLNARMSKWVNQMQTEKTKELARDDDDGGCSTKTSCTRSRLQYFNDHDIESCEFTEERDGRHYPKLSLVRLHLLAILLDCTRMQRLGEGMTAKGES